MAKEINKVLKLQIRGGSANPSPPVGPALGAAGVNIMEFCKQFNARTQDKPGKVVPVVISVFADKSFEFVIKTPPAAAQLLEFAENYLHDFMEHPRSILALEMREILVVRAHHVGERRSQPSVV